MIIETHPIVFQSRKKQQRNAPIISQSQKRVTIAVSIAETSNPDSDKLLHTRPPQLVR